ncbi:MAG TPA: SRPBCC domain-containing protein [Kofleriaceae bacterium]
MKTAITIQLEVPQAPAKVWRALTEPELLARWLLETDFAPQIGAAFSFQRDPMPGWDGKVRCEVLALELHKRLQYTWVAFGVDTVVTWTLEATASGGTKLGLEHSGFPPDKPQALGGAKAGWKHMTDALRGVVAEL